jgi:agmatine deiminase
MFRRFSIVLAVLILSLSACGIKQQEAPVTSTATSTWFMPAEDVPHRGTWMSWPARRDIWFEDLPGVRQAIARLANTLVNYEEVYMLVRPSQLQAAATMLDPRVDLIPMAVDDFWMRDTGPIFLKDQFGNLKAAGLNFNGWGKKQVYENDQYVAKNVATLLDVPFSAASIVTEGGAIEVDGNGTLLTTESSLINSNRNPGKTKAQIEQALKQTFGVQKILWVPGVKGQDITDGHIDALARFIRPGVVLVEISSDPNDNSVWAKAARDAVRILQNSTDAKGRKLKVLTIEQPKKVRVNSPDFLPSYINYYVANGVVIVAEFGDTVQDAKAKTLLQQAYPGRKIIQINFDAVLAGGGGIHCATQQEPTSNP